MAGISDSRRILLCIRRARGAAKQGGHFPENIRSAVGADGTVAVAFIYLAVVLYVLLGRVLPRGESAPQPNDHKEAPAAQLKPSVSLPISVRADFDSALTVLIS